MIYAGRQRPGWPTLACSPTSSRSCSTTYRATRLALPASTIGVRMLPRSGPRWTCGPTTSWSLSPRPRARTSRSCGWQSPDGIAANIARLPNCYGVKMIDKRRDAGFGNDYTDRMLIIEAIGTLRVKSVILDGEGVVCRPDSVSDFD